MAIAITDKDDMPTKDNVSCGLAELTAIYKGKVLHWVLPGGGVTSSKRYAKAYAERLNKMINHNVKVYDRDLLWS